MNNLFSSFQVVQVGTPGLPWWVLLLLFIFVGVILFETYYLLVKFKKEPKDEAEKEEVKKESLPKEKKKAPRQLFEARKILSIPYGIFLVLFIIIPLILIFIYAFTTKDGKPTLENWETVFANGAANTTIKVIGTSLGVAALTTVICVIIAFPIAYILANSKFNKNKVMVYMFLLPMWINFVIRTLATKQMLIAIGLDPSRLPWVCSIIGMVYNYLPFTILPLYNTMLKYDKNQIEAAMDLGANPVQVFFNTIIPMTIPGIVSAATMTFMPTMSSYVITDALSGRTIVLIGKFIDQRFFNAQANVGSVYAIIMLVLIAGSIVIEKAFSEKKGVKR